MILKDASQLVNDMKKLYGPNEFIANTLHPNPMKVVSVDEA